MSRVYVFGHTGSFVYLSVKGDLDRSNRVSILDLAAAVEHRFNQ